MTFMRAGLGRPNTFAQAVGRHKSAGSNPYRDAVSGADVLVGEIWLRRAQYVVLCAWGALQ